VVAAFEAAAAGGSALVVLDGWLVEELHVHAARRLLALGEAVEASEAEA
jgi:citrate lyase beta subunit